MILSSQSSVKINSSNPFLISPSIRQFFCEFTRIQVYRTCLIINLKTCPKMASKGLETDVSNNNNNQLTRTLQHSKKNLSQTNNSWHFWAKMLQYSTPVSPKYILQLFFLQLKYFRIRQLENLRAKRRTPFARNFSHFKKKERKWNGITEI